MTWVGKILVFVVLFLSVVVGALGAMVYAARTNWVDAYRKLDAQYQIAVASEGAYRAEAETARKAADAQVAAVRDQLKKAQDDLTIQLGVNRDLRDQIVAQSKKSTRSEAVAGGALKEIEKRQADTEQLRVALKTETETNTKLVKDNNELRDRAVAADIQLRTALERANRLEGQLQEMTKELVRTRANNAAGGAGARAGGKNPPPENVEGLIKSTDPASGLVTITIGSDAGLSKGNTLEVFRLSPVPHQSKYLGTIRVIEVTPTQAVGQPTGRMSAPPQPGDRVASNIMGG
jgi:hypothetical protein